MYLISDFGIVKQANKALKKLAEIKKPTYSRGSSTKNELSLGKRSQDLIDSNKFGVITIKDQIKNLPKFQRNISKRESAKIQAKLLERNPVQKGKPNLEYNATNDKDGYSVPKAKRKLIDIYNKKQILTLLDPKNPKGNKAKSKLALISNDVEYPRHRFQEDISDSSSYIARTLKNRRKERRGITGVDPLTNKLHIGLMKKDERIDFKPTQAQLKDIYKKHYAKENPGYGHEKFLLTGSPNHTWLTADGKYGEFPIGNSESPLDASMWKGRKSGKRMPKTLFEDGGSPVLGFNTKSAVNLTSMSDKKAIRNNKVFYPYMQSSERYANQIANKRYIPEE